MISYILNSLHADKLCTRKPSVPFLCYDCCFLCCCLMSDHKKEKKIKRRVLMLSCLGQTQWFPAFLRLLDSDVGRSFYNECYLFQLCSSYVCTQVFLQQCLHRQKGDLTINWQQPQNPILTSQILLLYRKLTSNLKQDVNSGREVDLNCYLNAE